MYDLAETLALAEREKWFARAMIRHARDTHMGAPSDEALRQLEFADFQRKARHHIANYLGYRRIAASMRRRQFSQAAE